MYQAPCKYRVEMRMSRNPYMSARVSHHHITTAANWIKGIRKSGASYIVAKRGVAVVVMLETGDSVEFLPFGPSHVCD